MMQVSKLIKKIIPALLLLTAITACNKMVDVNADSLLEEELNYRNLFDADAAIIGLYGKFMNLAERYVLLNELRADLMTTTENADENLRELNEHAVTGDNPYANPKAFYEVILNCNDILHHFNIMLQDKKLKMEEYNARYADVAALRCWVYMQLGIQFGRVPYITDPLSTTADISNVKLMPRIEFNQLIDELIRTMETLPSLEPYAPGSSLITSVDGYNTNKFFINKKVLLGRLYLWKNDYHKAAMALKSVMETGTGELYNYRLTGGSKGDNNDIAVGYERYMELNENMLINSNSQGWRSMFARDEDRLFGYEWVWYLPFENNFKPVNPFINLFSNRGGSYLVKPAQSAIDNWNSQVQKNDFPFDARGKIFSWRMLDGQPVIMKYLYSYLEESSFMPVDVFKKKGKWFLYRAASLHLNYAEAANRDRHPALAYALVNQGLTTIPNRITNEAFPYDFDARKSDNPRITGDWSLNSGIRGRAYLYSPELTGDSTLAIEDQIVNEAGLELAYEGQRWSDLVRIALRRNDPAFLADKIYQKLLSEHNPQAAAVRAKLMNRENWYLPFKWE